MGDFLLTSGASTLLAVGDRSWPVDLPHSSGQRRIHLCQGALGASGNSQQGVHIVDPATGQGAARFRNLWVRHPSAAFADAFSTACFVMTPPEIREFAESFTGNIQIISDPDWEISVRSTQG
jgi:thiamine biosynthesis lipoprotein